MWRARRPAPHTTSGAACGHARERIGRGGALLAVRRGGDVVEHAGAIERRAAAAARDRALELLLVGGERREDLAGHVVAAVFALRVRAGHLEQRGGVLDDDAAGVLGVADAAFG